ncbi:MAG: Maf family protein [Planctomycetota bacterium]
MNPYPKPLILASISPRRRELLAGAGYQFQVIAPRHDEPVLPPTSMLPAAHAEAISYFKAKSVAELVPQGFIIAADTVVCLNNALFGKPVNRSDAKKMLQALMGTTHHVITGLTLMDAHSGTRFIQHDVTAVTMRHLSESEIEEYLDTNSWQGKAGSYGIQDEHDPFVAEIRGSFTNVVGLPMELLARMFQTWPVDSAKE